MTPPPQGDPPAEDGAHPGAVRDRLLALIAVLLVAAGLRWSYPVTMPLAAAVFVVAAVWPVKPLLDRVLPSALSYLGTALLLVLALAAFIGAVGFALTEVVQAFLAHETRFASLFDTYAAWAQRRGLPVPGGDGGYRRLITLAQALLAQIHSVLAYLGLIGVLVILGLIEVPSLPGKLRNGLGGRDPRRVIETAGLIATRFRQYVGVTMLTSLLTGVASAAWAWVMGLELALVWGVLNFLLNLIPVVGNIIGILPPTLYAVLQFENWTVPLIVFVGYAGLQMTISNFVYPMLQSQSLSLSPAGVVLALTFWSWVWGVAGALVAVPLTVAVVIVCRQFHATRLIAALLSTDPPENSRDLEHDPR